MTDLLNLPGFADWRNQHAVKSTVPVTWTSNDVNFPWEKVELVNEIKSTDVFWNTFSSKWMLDLQDLFKSWACPVDGTTHYMSYLPVLPPGLVKVLDHFDYKIKSYNFLKITSGCSIVWHFDTFSSLVKRANLTQSQWTNLKRSVILLEDWDFGQVMQVGDDTISHWKAGDVVTWPSQAWHGASNFGRGELVVMQVSYYDE